MASVALSADGVDQKPVVKLIYGKGFNSRGQYITSRLGVKAKAYSNWHHMLERCYSPTMLLKCPTYIGCSVTDDWLDYQEFAAWHSGHEFSAMGYVLDKDILVPNNKIYSPKTCAFIPQELNKLLTDSRAARGNLPQGVHFHKRDRKYVAQTTVDNNRKSLGYFDCPYEAYQVYKIAKEDNVKKVALEWQDRIADNVFQALMAWELPHTPILDDNN